ncbi:uncharacterized protein [Chaetodon trifascialis]|uniref:uncharacterized protein isoform X2 n=1 Tax=Chaetodon trifascialis TaxID=109706 RepID=UPI003995E14F
MFKSLSSLQVHTGLISETGLNRTLASEDHKEQSGNMPESPKPQQASQEVKFELSQLPVGITCSVESQSEGGLPFGPTQHKSIFSSLRHGTPASKHPPHISVLTFPSQPSFKPFTQFKGGAAALAQPVTSLVKSRDSANSVSHHFAAKQLTEIPLPSKKTQSGLKSATKQHYSTETTADRSNEMAHCGELAAGCKKTLKRPFHSPFASPIADTLQPTADSGTDSSCTQGVTQFLSAAPPSADCTSNHLKTAPEPCKPSASSFLSLFAAPLSAAPLPCVQPQPDHSRTDDTTHFSGSKQGASDTETALPQVRTEGREICHAPRLSNFSPDLKIGRDSSTEHIDQPAKQPVSAVSSLVSDSLSEKSTSPAPRADSLSTSHQQLPEDSSHKATANPVLRTLFLRLGPYQQDGEQQGCTQISVPSESERRDQSGMCVFTKQQQKSKRKGSLQKKHEAPDSREQSTEKAEQQPSDRSPHISPEASGGSTLGGAGVTEPQGTDSDTHSSPLNPAVPLKQHHTQPRLKHTSEKGKRVSGSMAVTPLKDLFKTLDTAVFHCGH